MRLSYSASTAIIIKINISYLTTLLLLIFSSSFYSLLPSSFSLMSLFLPFFSFFSSPPLLSSYLNSLQQKQTQNCQVVHRPWPKESPPWANYILQLPMTRHSSLPLLLLPLPLLAGISHSFHCLRWRSMPPCRPRCPLINDINKK